MATATMRPNGDSEISVSSLFRSGGGFVDYYQDVDEEEADDADYHYIQGEVERDALFTHTAHGVPAGATINSVIIYTRGRNGLGQGSRKALIKIGGTKYAGTGYNEATYTVHGETWTVNPATGLAWTRTDLDNLVFGYRANSDPELNYQCRISQVYAEVDYTAAPATPAGGAYLLF